ncbi:MAG TPA: hypothetical protein VN924_08195 [Bryobacteraceae bacterium]|nr:hypothetical protein [Bryobacteraceae bacterium]
MNAPLILRLVGLRYTLLWAQTRTRNGRIALFLAGYLFAGLIVILMTAGGIGAAMVAVRSGQAEPVAQAVLGGLFVNALIASVVTGFGINTAFTDAALRRYALNLRERLAARHLTGILEPIWIFVLGLDLGLATGMYVFGAGSFWLGVVAVVLLLITDYLLARVLATLIEWLSHVRGGTAILFLMLMCACLLPSFLIPRLANAHGAKAAMMAALHYTPPFAAAALMAHAGAGLGRQFGILAGWIEALLLALAAIEKQAARPRGAVAAAAAWDNRYDRIASIFGPAMAPLVGRSLRYYVRSNKVRFNYIAAIPLLAFLTFNRASGATETGPLHYFVRALGAFAVAGFLGTAVMSTNQFGFDASGFRRYFLLPIAPGAILRASSYTALFVGSTLVAAAWVLWLLFAPVPFDPRMAPMLLASGVGGLCLFNALAIWTSLLAARPTNFETTFGNQLSLAANVLLIGGLLTCVFGVVALDKMAGPAAVLRWWWVPIPAAALAIAFYLYSLRRGAIVFVSRRERLLNTLEGRN